ncbi:MAG TPA: NUDIX hydrolase [Candidatus Dormibacteraeota bacterium]|nr:NUDIX hydrolase [Candidatus Dormibacteraeota bacterium]
MRLAATVMLVRPGASSGIELFLLRRSARSTFVPDAYVFPGGTVEAQDYDVASDRAVAGVAAQFRATVPRELPTDCSPVGERDAAALVRAALRELHEEAGVRLHDAGALSLFSHWITPPSEPRRYDTHFFIASAPLDQLAQADAVETHDGVWISPQRALERSRDGALYLVYPTIKHLERLLPFATVDEAIAFARRKPILTIMPSDSPANGFTMPAALENLW